jgi:hypothetical protein
VKQDDPAMQGKVLVSRNSLAEYVEGCLEIEINKIIAESTPFLIKIEFQKYDAQL